MLINTVNEQANVVEVDENGRNGYQNEYRIFFFYLLYGAVGKVKR